MVANTTSLHQNVFAIKPTQLNKKDQYRLLDNLGMTIFKHRDTFAAIQSQKLFLNPLCLVVLPYSPLELDPVSQKIFTGMISVLNIADTSICTIWPVVNITLDAFIHSLRELAAHSVLLLGEIFNSEQSAELNHAIDTMGCYRVNSFDPNILAEKTELKASTYRDLLNLKNVLRGQ